jgi:hypothetical protein
MTCECAVCRALAEDLRANAEALSALRGEELPPLVVTISRRAPMYPWVAAVVAAALLTMVALAPMHRAPVRSEPVKIKMLTPDPDVVIYWLIDSKERE